MSGVPCIPLRGGEVQMPVLGLGTWAMNAKDVPAAITQAVQEGYRLIDTAYLYENEWAIGETLQGLYKENRVIREDMFITSKLWMQFGQYSDVSHQVAHSLRDLKTDYLDLYLIHMPWRLKYDERSLRPMAEDGSCFLTDSVDHVAVWKELEKLLDSKVVKAIGLSNFNSHQLEALCCSPLTCHLPHNLQVECHAYLPQHDLCDLCHMKKISVTAFAPLGSPNRLGPRGRHRCADAMLMADATVTGIASSHSKSPSQVLLRYLLDRGVAVIPKSTNPHHLQDNINIFDFNLTRDDKLKLDKLGERNIRYFKFEKFRHADGFPFE